MLILGIETSCDETACAIVKNGREVIVSNIISQIEMHKEFGGVKPSIAKHEHENVIHDLIEKTLADAQMQMCNIDAVAVTLGPGLVMSLLVGLNKAKELHEKHGVKIIGVNHLLGHICSNYLESDLKPPFICLLVSGGHTQIIKVNSYIDYEILGSTMDDACGEAFDKVGRLLDLPYPGGPNLEKLALNGNSKAYSFPYPKVNPYDFSFSGLKTNVLRLIEALPKDFNKADLAASFQEKVCDILVNKITNAANDFGIETIVVAGGVSANKVLRQKLNEEPGYKIYMPNLNYCTDNAAMIASAGYFLKDEIQDLKSLDVFAKDTSTIKLKEEAKKNLRLAKHSNQKSD